MNARWQRYKALELISEQVSEPSSDQSFESCPIAPTHTAPTDSKSASQNALISFGLKFWQAIDMALIRDLKPRVWQSRDCHTGKITWNLYDPQTGKTRHLASESDVRDWLEQLIYR